MKWNLLFIFILALPALAETRSIHVDPASTFNGITKIKGDHVAYWPTEKSNGKLLITIGGTTSRPEDLEDFAKTAVSLGYHVISVDYFNLVITTACRDLDKTECFDNFREEIILGNPVSDLMVVDRVNSLDFRMRALMEFLTALDPQWKEFYNQSDFLWEKTVLMGNSQGAGHAAYLSKLHSVAGVLMVIGPQDHFKDRPAPWVLKPGLTPGDRYFAFLHRDDYFDSKLQIATYKDLCRCNDMSRVLITTREVPDTHNSLLTSMFTEEWMQLLQMPLSEIFIQNAKF